MGIKENYLASIAEFEGLKKQVITEMASFVAKKDFYDSQIRQLKSGLATLETGGIVVKKTRAKRK